MLAKAGLSGDNAPAKPSRRTSNAQRSTTDKPSPTPRATKTRTITTMTETARAKPASPSTKRKTPKAKPVVPAEAVLIGDGNLPPLDNRATGILQLTNRGAGALRDPERSLQPTPDDTIVPASLIREYKVAEGAVLRGPTQRGRLGFELASIESICSLAPEVYQRRKPFNDLVAISPNERFNLAVTGEVSLRVVDLIAPLGKGTRGLIVAPPKTGKTILLEQLARAIQADQPKVRLIMLLIDERPEEVTHFRRALDVEVFASSNDQSLDEHVALAELTMAHMRAELEAGNDVVVLVDSLTRMARAYNLHGQGARRTMSGGVDAKALEIPRRFFGLARNIENGGSITILATALIETGSRMDELIFQEFKGTGNSEIVLDRELAEARVFPAINLNASSTRNEELLYNADDMARLAKLRRWLASGKSKQAMNGLLKLIGQTKDNEELLRRIRLEG
ncbi:MAG: transcription termination factor Rho [Caldilineaceae bacterium]